MKKFFIISVIGITMLVYGILIGRYEFFPFDLMKRIKSKIELKEVVQDLQEPPLFELEYLEKLLSVKPSNVDSVRQKLKAIIFGTSELPKQLPDTIFEVVDPAYRELNSIEKIERFEVRLEHGFRSIGYIFHPNNSVNKLLIYNQGHQGDFIKGKKTIQYFLEKGFTVYAFSMPLRGKNNRPNVYIEKLGNIQFTKEHDTFRYLKHPMHYFISPVITMVNYAERKEFDDIIMTGLSGGGWTTVVTAALDTRIRLSFPVAGTYPMFIRFQRTAKELGDFEHNYEKLYSQINYLDLYVLGATGRERAQLQIFNKYDACCFSGDYQQIYSDFITSNVRKFADGKFAVFSDTSHHEHKISNVALSSILAKIKTSPILKKIE